MSMSYFLKLISWSRYEDLFCEFQREVFLPYYVISRWLFTSSWTLTWNIFKTCLSFNETFQMTFFKEVENISDTAGGVPALESYLPNSIIYVVLYILALPPNLLLAYMGLKPGLITSRVKYPTLGMSLANLFGLIGFLVLNVVYLFAVTNDVSY